MLSEEDRWKMYESAHKPTPCNQSALIRRYALHIIGPDDIIEQADELTALREANKLNAIAAREHAKDPDGPYLIAIVVPLEHLSA